MRTPIVLSRKEKSCCLSLLYRKQSSRKCSVVSAGSPQQGSSLSGFHLPFSEQGGGPPSWFQRCQRWFKATADVVSSVTVIDDAGSFFLRLLLAWLSPHLLLSEQDGGTSFLVDWLLITSPSSVSHLVNSYPSHFVSSVHQDWSLNVWYLDSLHDLSVQGLVVCSRHPHHVDHVLPAVREDLT